MNKDSWAETALGAVATGVAIAFLAFAVAQAGDGPKAGGYALEARFQRVDGIAAGSDVRLSGVKVGTVSAVELDTDTYFAKLTLALDGSVKVPDDSTAKVSSDGLLGGAHIAIEPGGSETMLTANGEILNTQGAVDLLTVLASAVSQMGGGERGAETQEAVE